MFFNFSIIPLRLASVMGALLCSVGLVMLVEHIISPWNTSPDWGSLMAAISIFSGGQLMMLGMIGEYVGRAYMSVSGKPQSLVQGV